MEHQRTFRVGPLRLCHLQQAGRRSVAPDFRITFVSKDAEAVGLGQREEIGQIIG